MENEETKTAPIVLPQRLVTTVDLARVTRELKMLDDWLNQAALRETGKPIAAPKTSATLEDLASTNNVSLLDTAQRQKLLMVLKDFSTHAPKIHMSFAVEPSAAFLQRMIIWLRTNISPSMLLDVGLQPTLAAGCTVRTINKLFDMSLRHRFVDSRPLLVQSIAKFQNDPPKVMQAEAPPEPTTTPTTPSTTPTAPTVSTVTAETSVPPATPTPAIPATEAKT